MELSIPTTDVNMQLIYKDYIIKSDKHFPSMLVIATAGQGGKIPKVMESLFTSVGEAKNIIDAYMEGKQGASKEKRESGT